MLLNARDVPQGTLLEAQACVIGAGPAGIAVALSLAKAGVEVILVEAGGFGIANMVRQYLGKQKPE